MAGTHGIRGDEGFGSYDTLLGALHTIHTAGGTQFERMYTSLGETNDLHLRVRAEAVLADVLPKYFS
jgi:hypothetical protein